MSDLWLIEYEKILDDYTRNCGKLSEEDAEVIARYSLKRLGLDPSEIDEQIMGLKA